MSVNLDGALNVTRAGVPEDDRGGSIVNQSSTAAWMYSGFYGLAKAGINNLTFQLSQELGGNRIRVNAIAPGPTDTEAAAPAPRRDRRDMVSKLPIKRFGKAEDPSGCSSSCCRTNRRGSPARSSTSTAARCTGMSENTIRLGCGPGQHRRTDGHEPGQVGGRHDRLRPVRRRRQTKLVDAGAAKADSLADLAANADIIGICVLNDAQVRTVVSGEGGLLSTAAPGTIIAIHSTIGPQTAIDLAAEASERA